jgi:hypothetical protein
MHEITRSRYNDAKKVPEMPKLKQNTVEKSRTTFTERKDHYLPFHRKVEVPQQVEQSRQVEGERQSTVRNSSWYDWAAQAYDKASSMVSRMWKKKSTLLLGVMLASARGLGADAHLQRGGTALGLLDSSNATGLPPALDWRGFNPANRTALPEFDPSRVPPGFTDYLRKVGAPESLQDSQSTFLRLGQIQQPIRQSLRRRKSSQFWALLPGPRPVI